VQIASAPFAQAGFADDALVEIKPLLNGPSRMSVHTLRLDPRWDPIRNDPRFQALLVKYAKPQPVRRRRSPIPPLLFRCCLGRQNAVSATGNSGTDARKSLQNRQLVVFAMSSEHNEVERHRSQARALGRQGRRYKPAISTNRRSTVRMIPGTSRASGSVPAMMSGVAPPLRNRAAS
jgi:hypothetical protein